MASTAETGVVSAVVSRVVVVLPGDTGGMRAPGPWGASGRGLVGTPERPGPTRTP